MKSPMMILLGVLLTAVAAGAGEADVEAAEAIPKGDGRYRIRVTVRHADTGWEHYADRFEILDGQGNLLGTRVLHHPHVDEQPFTRRLDNVLIPAGIKRVTVRAHDSQHGYGGRTMTLKLPDR